MVSSLQGIATLALDSPYSGERKPHYQQGELLLSASAIMPVLPAV